MTNEWLYMYHRLSNYLSVAMLYLKDNFFLESELTRENIKERILGHWGTVPGLNLFYGITLQLIKTRFQNDGLKVMFTAGPGHGAPAVLAGLFLENTLSRFYSLATRDKKGAEYLIKNFSWPGGFPSHAYPGLPGQILEGGELGYSLATAFGSVFDNKDLVNICVIGDGEAETGTLSASWQSNKFINPGRDGVVLPVLHLNSYKISGPTLFSLMSEEEIKNYFQGLGYKVHYVDQYPNKDTFIDNTYSAFENAAEDIYEFKQGSGQLPIVVVKSMKGWTGPSYLHQKKIEDNNLSHGIPIQNPKKDDEEFESLKSWLLSYSIGDFFDETGEFSSNFFNMLPANESCPGATLELLNSEKLIVPAIDDFEIRFDKRGAFPESRMEEISKYIKSIFDKNEKLNNFRVFSPDESESNMMEDIFSETGRILNRKVSEWTTGFSDNGRIMEILSENVLQSWLEGYVKTGRNGIFVSYEAFLGIVTSQIDQYLKYLKQCSHFLWRKEIPSLNYISTSTGWRQDHNGFSHQNPALINSMISRPADYAHVYFPADVNIFLATLEESLNSKNAVNLIIADKRELPQWLTMAEAREHVRRGVSEWQFAGNYENEFDIVLASAGDHQTKETLAAAVLLKKDIPELKFKFININELSYLGLGDDGNPLLTMNDINSFFGQKEEVILNFHGYPSAIKQLIFGTSLAHRTNILGYIEEGSTTTPFDMQVVNKASRYHVCLEALFAYARKHPNSAGLAQKTAAKYHEVLRRHQEYILANGTDLPEVTEFVFEF